MISLNYNAEARNRVDNFISTLSNSPWRHIYRSIFGNANYYGVMYDESTMTAHAGAVCYTFEPTFGNSIVSYNRQWLNPKKFAAVYKWYHEANPKHSWITKYFKEYEHCVDVAHDVFRSNYGVYVYGEHLLDYCYEELRRNINSRRACMVINDRSIMLNDSEIDKLCTNAIHFFIRNNYLQCVVQMRSSNMATLLPYDAFMFSVFMAELWQKLHANCYEFLIPGSIKMQIADAHMTLADLPDYNNNETTAIRENTDLIRIAHEVNMLFTDDKYQPTITNFLNI